ncbi:hypothetical protein [Pasteurella multocida]|uniref:hypothetical protein n=1 Tax=Pasteurella multocida TaxID=747 RepID=UPI002010E431|nr:hypothetical protein [Pasteurella multocida]
MLRRIIEKERYKEDYLEKPSEKEMQSENAVSICNETHLFIADQQHKRYGQALRVQDVMDSTTPEKPEDGDILVKDQQAGAMIGAKESQSAVRVVVEMVTLKERASVLAKSALQLFKG